MTNNTQLPAEVISQIKDNAETYAGVMIWVNQNPKGEEQLFYEYIAATSHEAGATEYATKWHEAQQEIESLTNQLKDHANVSNENMKLLRQENELWKKESIENTDALVKARVLIEKMNAKYGALHHEALANEIKTFLDGTQH